MKIGNTVTLLDKTPIKKWCENHRCPVPVIGPKRIGTIVAFTDTGLIVVNFKGIEFNCTEKMLLKINSK